MKNFLRRVISFILIPILYFGINILINYLIFTNQSFPLKKSTTLILGDSHTQKSLDPKYFDDAQNISQPSEPYILTFWKLNKIIETYIPDEVILGFAPHNISQFNDRKFSDAKWSHEMFKRVYPIQEFNTIQNEISIDLKTYQKVFFKQTAFYPKADHINYIGSYSNCKINNLSNPRTTIKKHYYHKGQKLGVSKSAVKYLRFIVELCESKKIKLIIVSPPVHEKYFENIPEEIKKKYFNLYKKYSDNHIVFDKIEDNYPDSLYLDFDHLNEIGAKKFTIELIDYLE